LGNYWAFLSIQTILFWKILFITAAIIFWFFKLQWLSSEIIMGVWFGSNYLYWLITEITSSKVTAEVKVYPCLTIGPYSESWTSI
jgi:hypothetical protein